MQRYLEYFSSSFRVNRVTKNDFYFNVFGVVLNQGKACWESPDYNVGVLVRDHCTEGLIYECRADLSNAVISKGEFQTFNFKVPLAYIQNPKIQVVLDVVKEREFWFKDVSNKPFSFEVDLEQLESYSDKCQDVPFELISCKIESGLAKGELHLQSGCPSLKMITPSNESLSFPTGLKNRPAVSHYYFQCLLDRSETSQSISIVTDDSKEYLFPLPQEYSQSDFEICFDECSLLKGSLFNFSFALTNLSECTLVLRSPFEPNRTLQAVVLDSSKKQVFSYKFKNFPDYLKSGDSFQISEVISLHALEPGSYEAKIGLAGVIASQTYSFSLESAPKLGSNDKSVLVVAPSLPRAKHESGGLRLLELLKVLKDESSSLTFCYEKEDLSGHDYLISLEGICDEVFCGPLELLSKSGEPFSHIIVTFHECAKRNLDLLQFYYPKAQVIVDSVDIHWVRLERGKACGFLDMFDEELAVKKGEELAIYDQVDLVWAVTDEDKKAIKALLPDKEVQIISNIHHRSASFELGGMGDDLLFVGNFLHAPNVMAAKRAIEIVTKFNEGSHRTISLNIVGANLPTELLANNENDYVKYLGHVEDLVPWYNSSKLLIAPLDFGSGIKGKVCHAVCHGLPVLTSRIGVEGLGLVAGLDVLLAETDDEYIQKLEGVYSGLIDTLAYKDKALEKVLAVTDRELASIAIRQLLLSTQYKETIFSPSASAR